MKSKLVYVQFDRWDKEHYPEINNSDYLDYKEVNTGHSKEVCSFGWREDTLMSDDVERKRWKYRWITKAEAKKRGVA